MQMAHVMNYEEILRAAENRTVVWEELRGQEKVRPMCFDGADFAGISGSHYLLLLECENDCEDYNWNYRLWNNMPTQLERRTNKWKEDPYA